MTKMLFGATALSAFLIATPALARPMTPEDVAKLKSVGAIAVSPDGARVAYQSGGTPDIVAGEENDSYQSKLMIATGPQQATEYLPSTISASDIKFSPDGRWVSFLHKAEDDDHRSVYALPVYGGTYRKIAALGDAGVNSHAWAPDGASIYMLAAAAEDEARDKEKDKGFDAIVYEEEARFNRLFRAAIGDLDAGKDPAEIAIPGYVTEFKVSPDGSYAVIGSQPTPQIDDTYTSKRFHVLDLASGNVRAEVKTPGKVGDVEISPDGRQLSLIAGVDMNDPADTTIHLVDTATGEFRALNAGAPEAAVDGEWLDDGRLAVIIHKGAQSVLRYYDAAGNMAGEVDPGALILTGIEADGGTLVARASSPSHPSELFKLDGGSFTRWTESNAWLKDIDLGKQETFRYTARDGQEIEGVLIHPVGGVPQGGAPLIMDVHGGPEAHESNGWVTNYGGPGQVAAGKGYAVFLPNYRGSTGYGTAFSKQHQGRYTDPEFADLVDAKRALVERGIADRDRVGITGGSYGGYASAWAATALSEEFAAAVMFVGISNQISKFGTTDIPYEMYNVHSRAWPWDNWQKMLEVSPIYHVDKADTPILILHGEEDTRVSPSQSYELYRSIKVRTDTPVRLVLYPGEGHGNRKAAAQYDYNLRMMRWFDTYLKTGDRDAPLPDPRPKLLIEADAE
ncbi:S9 family peptidase [Sphingomicrobium lutaoense]|uniref:Dipeptidyl aminopeptidase/acylaminoacyl peptidase n=1 Tax=Sphingomicrobium lutaoense TaxID=515949 RepID=A0A839Z2C6_9SPHN|nr:S9 family peptidase [Sphingomicrobium lutaoense]MBB3764708.1 dipeptidyl aminopeptidase/acylaminoacyl peptidase [Sphingomicrobium lutaoense]